MDYLLIASEKELRRRRALYKKAIDSLTKIEQVEGLGAIACICESIIEGGIPTLFFTIGIEAGTEEYVRASDEKRAELLEAGKAKVRERIAAILRKLKEFEGFEAVSKIYEKVKNEHYREMNGCQN